MRKTSVPTFVLIAAVMLLLGYLNRTNDHLMITATLNDTTLNASQVLVDDELPMNYDATTHHQFWTGGGVLGLSEGDENVAKDAMSAKLREAFIELFHLPMAQFEHRHISRVSAYSVTQFRRLFMSLAAVNNNSDCLVRMDPFKQLQCYMWAE
ncbi:transmembrane protein, putative, partial [Bodo saltans]